MEDHLRLVYRYLDADLNDNALFLASALHALDPGDGTWAHLKALACLRLGNYGLAREYSRTDGLNGSHLGCAYVFAMASLHQGHYLEGITALERARPHWESRHWATSTAPHAPDTRIRPADSRCKCLSGGLSLPLVERFWPDRPAAHCLLAKLHRRNGEQKPAVRFFVEALESDALMWDSLTSLCDMGATMNLAHIFDSDRFHLGRTVDPDTNSQTQHNQKHGGQSTRHGSGEIRRGLDSPNVSLRKKYPRTVDDAENSSTVQQRKRHRPGFSNPIQQTGASSSTRRFNAETAATMAPSFASGGRVPRLHTRAAVPSGLSERPAFQASGNITQRPIKPMPALRDPRHTSSTELSPRFRQGPYLSRRRDDIQQTLTLKAIESKRGPEDNGSAARRKLVQTLDVFQLLGTAYYNLARYEPKACLEAFSRLPIEVQATPWVLSKSARAHYELMDYAKAKQQFQTLRACAPSWTEDLEVYSTVLWHLKDEIPLALLAHELTESHYRSPETWCAAGNSFSVARDSDEAVRCFRRACQLSPQLAQAHSLLGYELMDKEEYHEAVSAFRRTVQLAPRFYTAWVGLGRVHERMGQLDVGLKYYLAAVGINPSNPIIYTYIARVLALSNMRRSAVEYLRRAIRRDPPPRVMALIRMQRAGIFLAAGQPGAALDDLRAVALVAPEEPRVHLLLGRAYASQGDKAAALKSYTAALSLAPSSEEIKDAMCSLEAG